MTRVRIEPGACGMPVTVEVEKKDRKTFVVRVLSECKMVERLGAEIPGLTMMDAFTRLLENPVYKKAAACLKHVSCPVPTAILKALEVEAGLAVAKPVVIEFVKEEDHGQGTGG